MESSVRLFILISVSTLASGSGYVQIPATEVNGIMSSDATTVRTKTECLRLCTLDSECDIVAFKYSDDNTVNCQKLLYVTGFQGSVDNSYKYFGKENPTSRPTDCKYLLDRGVTEDGLYSIYIPGLRTMKKVYCDMTGGGWLVIQRRKSSGINFHRKWNEYRDGFGNLSSEFWLGNDYIHHLTSDDTMLRVQCVITQSGQDVGKNSKYSSFSVASGIDFYKLTISSLKDGYDAMDPNHDGKMFSTEDVDNDRVADQNFANKYGGGWWYAVGINSNLNGYNIQCNGQAAKLSEMKIRPSD